MSQRVKLTGTLLVVKVRKIQSRDWLTDNVIFRMENAGVRERKYWPFLYVLTDVEEDEPTNEYIYRWKARGKRAPQALHDLEPGSPLGVTATLEEWANGLGADLVRSVVHVIPLT